MPGGATLTAPPAQSAPPQPMPGMSSMGQASAHAQHVNPAYSQGSHGFPSSAASTVPARGPHPGAMYGGMPQQIATAAPASASASTPATAQAANLNAQQYQQAVMQQQHLQQQHLHQQQLQQQHQQRQQQQLEQQKKHQQQQQQQQQQTHHASSGSGVQPDPASQGGGLAPKALLQIGQNIATVETIRKHFNASKDKASAIQRAYEQRRKGVIALKEQRKSTQGDTSALVQREREETLKLKQLEAEYDKLRTKVARFSHVLKFAEENAARLSVTTATPVPLSAKDKLFVRMRQSLAHLPNLLASFDMQRLKKHLHLLRTQFVSVYNSEQISVSPSLCV